MTAGKVLHIITGLGVGGAEQQLRLLLRHMPMRCDVLTLTNPGPVAEGLRADGVRVVHLGMRGNRDLGALPRMAKFIRRGRYDLVHTHLYRACVYGRLATRFAGTGVSVATEHSLGEGEIEGRPLSRGVRSLYLASERLGAATVAVSETVASRLEAWGVPAGRVHVVPNGIEAVRFRFDEGVRRATRARTGLPERTFVVGGVGRLVPGKRFDVLVRAVAALPGAHLLLAGDGPERAALRRLAAELGAQSRIHLLGERDPLGDSGDGRTPGIPALLAAMDVFVSPSREEAFGLAVIEALAAGLPVLHVTCPAIDDLPPTQAPGARRIGTGEEELVAALRGHMEAGVRRLPAPAVVRRYDIARSARLLLDVYDLALSAPPASRRGAVPAPAGPRSGTGSARAGAAPLPGAGPRTPAPQSPAGLILPPAAPQTPAGLSFPAAGLGFPVEPPQSPAGLILPPAAPQTPAGLSSPAAGLGFPAEPPQSPAGLGLPAAGLGFPAEPPQSPAGLSSPESGPAEPDLAPAVTRSEGASPSVGRGGESG